MSYNRSSESPEARERRLKKAREKYQLNKEERKEYFKKYRETEKFKESVSEYQKTDKWKNYLKEREKQEKRKEYHSKRNKSVEGKEYRSKYNKERKQKDPIYRLKYNISCLIRNRIKSLGYSKKSKTYQILGCSFEEFKIHIESQFKDDMTWENYGEWQYDHIIPISSAVNEEEVFRLNHYTNFQPLWKSDNLRKGNKIITI